MQKHIQHNKDEWAQFFRKIYLDFIWKGSKGLLKVLLCERWVGDWTELQHIDPHSYGHNSISFPFSWAAQLGSSFQLIWTSCCQGYIIIWRPPTSCKRHNFALNSTTRQSRSSLISWYLQPDAPVIYTGAFLLLTAWLGRRSICNNHPMIIFQNSTCGIFFMSISIPSHTHFTE